MEVRNPGGALDRLAKEVGLWGSVVRYHFVDLPEGLDPDSEQTHRTAAIVVMRFLIQERRADAAALEERLGRPVTCRAQMDQARAESMRGRRVNVVEFLGSRYDLEQRGPDRGYAYAFTEPPHGLSLERGPVPVAQVQKALEAIADEILGPSRHGCTIYSWPDDWSDWFEPGRDWWGNFFWTVHRPDHSGILVVCASESD